MALHSHSGTGRYWESLKALCSLRVIERYWELWTASDSRWERPRAVGWGRQKEIARAAQKEQRRALCSPMA